MRMDLTWNKIALSLNYTLLQKYTDKNTITHKPGDKYRTRSFNSSRAGSDRIDDTRREIMPRFIQTETDSFLKFRLLKTGIDLYDFQRSITIYIHNSVKRIIGKHLL